MKRLLIILFTFLAINAFAQEGTKQLMPNANDRLFIEFGTFAGSDFGLYDSDESERINVHMNVGEKLHFGMKMVDFNYGGNVFTDRRYASFRILDPDGVIVYSSTTIPGSGNGYISNYSQAVTGPNGAILNESVISGGYNPLVLTAAKTGNYYFEFQYWRDRHDWYGDNEKRRRRFALEYFDVTVTDNANNVITNPGEPNKSAGRLWSYAWHLSNTSFNEYPVNAHFYVFTEDEFVNKVNFQMYPFSFIFLANHFGVTTYTEENYIRRTQSQEGDQTGGEDVAEYRIFLNDPDRSVWPNTLLAPPRVQVWAEEELFMDYNYNRNPLYEDLDYSAVVLEKNRPNDCPHEDVTFFKIEANMDGFTAILIDIDGDGEYSTGGSDRVIYRVLKKGLNYILWDFKTDAGAQVANGSYSASATFFGRGPAHFPMYDVEQLDGITTSAIRPFNKLNTTIYWDDTNISNWGDMYGGDLMDETQQKQLKVEEHVPRTWMYRGDWANTPHNGEVNTMNTWFNAIDLGYGDIGIVVQESDSKCVDGSAPYVGDVYLEGPKDQDIVFDVEDFDFKFFHPAELPLSAMQILSLPSEGTLLYSGSPVTTGQVIARSNVGNLSYSPPSAEYHGKTSFEWKANDSNGNWSNNQENVYLIINTPPTISPIDNQVLCTNSNTDVIDITVNDAETPANELVVTGFSANPEFVPHTGISIGGSGESRTVTVTPVANKSGRAIIYIMVDDGLSQVIQQFAVTVSPSLEFSGDTIVCLGEDLFLMADEAGADTYEWSYNGTVMSTERIVEQTAPVSVGTWTLTITKTIDEGKAIVCESTREFQVEVAPLTTFSGDTDVCVGESISLTATEVNAEYSWKKDGNELTTSREFSKSSAAMSDAGTTYTLYVDKAGCQNTSDPFTITVKEQPNVGLTVNGSTVDPDKDATITINQAQNNIFYNVYNESGFVPSDEVQGADLVLTIPASYLEVGENEFTIKADNENCEVELNQKAIIYVNQPGVTVSPLTLTTQEDGDPQVFEVVLNTEPTGNVTINVVSDDTSEGTVNPSSVTFTLSNWSTPQEIQVFPVMDHAVDGDQTYTIELSLANGNSYYNINPDNVTVTNTDVDLAGVTVTPTTLTTTEAGSTDNFTIVLNTVPESDVVINFSGVDSNEGTINPTSVTFTSGNWDTPQTLTVTGVDDNIDDGDISYTINPSAISSDSNYDGISIPSVSVTNIDNDTAGISVSPTSITTYENQSEPAATFDVVLDTRPTAGVTVTVSSNNTSEGTVTSAGSFTFTSSNWSTPRTVSVKGVDDNVVDGDINYAIDIAVSSTSDAKYQGQTAVVSALNIDNDVAGILTSKSNVETTEDGGTDSFNVTLQSEPTQNITLSVVSNDISEATVTPEELVFTSANWNASQQVTILGVDDDVIDGNQNYSIILSVASGDAVYNAVSNAVVNGVNLDNNVAEIIITKTSLETSEDGTSDSFDVALTSQPSQDVEVSFAGLNATEGSLNPESLTFTSSNWDQYQTVTVTGVNDDIADGNQTYSLTPEASSTYSPYSGVTGSVITVVNIDNNSAGVNVSPTTIDVNEGESKDFNITLSSQPTDDVTINISSQDDNEVTVNPSSVVFTSSNWAAKAVTVHAVDDNIDDGDHTYTVSLSDAVSDDSNYGGMSVSNVTVNVTDIHTADITVNPTEGLITTEAGDNATFTVRLNTKPTSNVTITPVSQDPSEGVVTSSPLTFTPSNWDSPQTVTVRGVDDHIDDDDQAYTVLVQVSSTDPNYDASLNKTVHLVNEDNDTAEITVSPTEGLITSEDGTKDEFSVVLQTKPTHYVTINLESSDPTEGTVFPVSMGFSPDDWDKEKVVELIGQDDDVVDGDQIYTITLTSSSTDPKYNGISIPSVGATNTDNDIAEVVLTPTTGLITTEDEGEATFTVKLNSQPTNRVFVSSVSDDDTEGTVVSGSSLTFTIDNWDTPQTVTVRGVNDFVADDNQPYTVSLSAESDDANYDEIEIGGVSLTNEDNDNVGLILSKASLESSEPDIQDSFTVMLESEPIDDVTVSLSSDDTSEGIVSAATSSLTFTPATWSTPQEVVIVGQDDNMVDGDIAYNIILSASSSSDAQYNSLADVLLPTVNLDNNVADVNVNPVAGLSTNESGGTAEFSVTLNSMPANSVSIRLYSTNTAEGLVSAVSRGSVDVVGNEAFITFEPNEWDSPVLVTIIGVDDDVDDGDIAYYINTDPVVSGDPNYNGLNVANVSLTNVDDDNSGTIVTPTNITLNEEGNSEEFTIVLRSRPTHSVTFNFTSDNTQRVTVSPVSVDFLTTGDDWKTPKSLTVTPVDNQIADGDDEVTIITERGVSDDDNYDNLNPSDVTVSVVDDDIAEIIVSSITGPTTEGGGEATFTVVLSSEPTDVVDISMYSSSPDEGLVTNVSRGTATPGSNEAAISFDSSNWDEPVTITVTGQDDALDDGNQTYYIEFNPTQSTDVNYHDIQLNSVEAINVDNNTAGYTVTPLSGVITNEEEGTAEFKVYLNTEPTGDVVVDLESSDISEGIITAITSGTVNQEQNEASITFTSTNWSDEVTVTVTGVDDVDPDGDISYQIILNNNEIDTQDDNYKIEVPNVSLTNRDDWTPRPADDAATTDQENPVTFSVLENDLGLDYTPVAVTVHTQPEHGTAVANEDNTITYTPDRYYHGVFDFEYRVINSEGNFANATVSITVTRVDVTPIANNDFRGASMNTPVEVDVLFNDENLYDIPITVTTVGTVDPDGDFEVIGENTIRFTPSTDYIGIATFNYRVADNDGDFDEAIVTINVREENHVPVANNLNETVVMNTPKNINVLANDSGLEDGFGSLTIHNQPENGTVVINANRSVTYTPDSDYVGDDSFVYMLEDVDGDYDLATVSIEVIEKPNSVPVANPVSRATEINTPITFDVLFNDNGLEDGVASVVATPNPINGTAIVNDDFTITYTPDSDYMGTEVFGYQVCDIDGDCATASITIIVKDAGTNHNPVAVDDNAQTYENASVDIDVLSNDYGLEDGFGELVIHSNPSFGSVVVNSNNSITYTPYYMSTGTDEFEYRLHDSDGDWDKAKVTVEVIEKPNFIPLANDVSLATEFETPVDIDVLYNDENLEDEPILVSISTPPSSEQGTATVNPDNTIHFIPENGFEGTVTFNYTVTDKDGDSDNAQVTVIVLPDGVVNHLPVAGNIEATTSINTPIDIDVLSHVDGLDDGFGYLVIHSEPDFGEAIVNANRTITYTPANYFVGQVTFTYRVADIHGDWDTGEITVDITEKPNSVPEANDVSLATEFETPIDIDVLYNDTGLDDEPISVTISIHPNVDEGTATVNADNTINFVPQADFDGNVIFRYTVTDADGDSDDAQVTVIVLPDGVENHVPHAGDISVSTYENTPVDIDVLTHVQGLDDGFGYLIIHSEPEFGNAVVNDDRTVTFTPANHYIGTVTFKYRVADIHGDWDIGEITVVVTERPNFTPVANDVSVATEYETPVDIDVLYNDENLEDEPIVVSISTPPSSEHGTATVNSDNTINFIPENGFDGNVTFAYSVTDVDGDSDNAQVTVIVLPDGVENHVPVAEDINVNTTVNTPVNIDVLSHVQGLDDGFGYLVIHELPYIGNAVVNDNRTVTYTPANLFVGQVTFVYRVADAHGDWDTGVITVDVTEQPNSTPVANDLSVATSFNTPIDIDVLHNDTGLDDVPITVTINYPPNADHGTAVVNDDNTVTFTPAQDYIGGTFFQYTVTDTDGDADFATVNVVVKSGENFVPVANNDEATTYLNTPVQIDVLANDSGLEDGFGDLIIQQNPQFGDVVVNDDYTVTFTPANYFLGQIDFTYKLSDLDGDYDFGNVTVFVNDEYNPIPVAYNDSIGTSFNEPVSIDVLANDTNLDDTPITVTIFEHPSIFEGETSVNADNSITFTPNQDFSGPVNFRYLVTDANGDSDNANVKVTVKDGLNNIPVANDDRRGTSFETPVTVDVTANDTGLEDQPILVTISSEPTSTEGVAAVNDDNTVTFTPESNFVGVVEFIYRIIDADGDWDEATVTISVKSGENMVPDANDLNAVTHINLQTTINVLENDTGIDDEPLSLIITVYPSVEEGTVEINDDNRVNFIPYQDFLGATKFTYKIIDNDGDFDTAEVSVSVIHEIIANNDEFELERGETITINVLENDHGLNGIEPTVSILEQPNHGVVTVDSEYNLIYTAPDDYVGQDVLTYQVCSQYGGCSQANVNVEIINVGIVIPEGFSPDGDGINDFFEIIGLEYYDQVKVKIYNRWGNLVYQSMDYKNDWDGTANSSLSVGRTLPNGTYYYIIEIVDTDDRINGNVFLKR